MSDVENCEHCGRYRLFHRKDCPVAPGKQRREAVTTEETRAVRLHTEGRNVRQVAAFDRGFRAVDSSPAGPVMYGRTLNEDEFIDLRQQGQFIDDETAQAGWGSLPWEAEADA